MSGRDRTRRAVHHQPVDRIPVFPIQIASACQMMGVRQKEYFLDPEVMSTTLVAAGRALYFDGIYISRDNWVYHEALGGALVYPDDDETYARQVVLPDFRDYTKLQIPDPASAPGMKTVLAAARKTVEESRGEFYLQANIDTGPFSLAAVLRGTQQFIMDLHDERPEDIRDFLRFCTDVVVAYGRAMIATGVDAIQMGEATAGLLGDQLFREYVLPYLVESVERLSNTSSCDRWVHICGNSAHLLPLLRQVPMEGFELDSDVDMRAAKEILGGGIALKGNVNTSFLLHASEEEVYEACITLLREGQFATGIILSPGCGVPKMTPPSNLRAMVRASKDYRP